VAFAAGWVLLFAHVTGAAHAHYPHKVTLVLKPK
jgi:hypothetical protein